MPTTKAERIRELRRELRELEAEDDAVPTPAEIRDMSDEEIEELADRLRRREHDDGGVFGQARMRRAYAEGDDPEEVRARRVAARTSSEKGGSDGDDD